MHYWGTWKQAIAEQFKRKMTLQDFIDFQKECTLRSDETLVQYMYTKTTMLEKAPRSLSPDEHISLILSGIKEDKWAIPQAAKNFNFVLELIDRAVNLDSRRQLQVQPETE